MVKVPLPKARPVAGAASSSKPAGAKMKGKQGRQNKAASVTRAEKQAMAQTLALLDRGAAAEGKARAASDAEQQKFNEIDAALRSFNAEPSSSACLETPGSGPSTLPTTPTTNMSILDKIRELAKFKSQGLIDEDEYKKMKARILE